MKLNISTKLLLGFIGMVAITAVACGLAFWQLNSVVGILSQMAERNAPAIENATGVERYALRTILDERDYLLYQEGEIHQRAMQNIDQIYRYLDQEAQLAARYDDQELAAKVEQVRAATAEYQGYYNQGVALLAENSDLEWTMRLKGREMNWLAQEYISIRDRELDEALENGDDVEKLAVNLRIVHQIDTYALEARRQEKNYMLFKEPEYLDLLSGHVETLRGLYDQLEAVSTTEADETRIAQMRQATESYYQAALEWRANDDSRQAIQEKMAVLGVTMQETAQGVQDVNWETMATSKEAARRTAGQASRVTVAIPLVALVLGLALGVGISRTVSRPIAALVEATRGIATGDLSRTVEVRSRDELGVLAGSFNHMVTTLKGSREETERYSLALQDKLQETQTLAEDLQSANEEMEIVNEELQTRGEELESANRDLERTYRELKEAQAEREQKLQEVQALSEELQSANEEMEVVNEELKTRSEDLEVANREQERAYRELRETQAQLVQAGKMAAIGQLAGGVAHELNNPLTGVLIYAKRLFKKVDDSTLRDNAALRDFPESLRLINEAALRCKDITDSLLTFSRQAGLEFAPLDVNEVIENTLTLIKSQLKSYRITLVQEWQPDLPPVVGNANQLQQVFTNLIINAQQAMPDRGELTIVTSCVDGQFVRVRFSDTGCGIPEENLDRIFEPFFTTRPVGQGTGLGLSVSYGIIEAHGGFIEVESKVGVGSTFTVRLPVGKAS